MLSMIRQSMPFMRYGFEQNIAVPVFRDSKTISAVHNRFFFSSSFNNTQKKTKVMDEKSTSHIVKQSVEIPLAKRITNELQLTAYKIDTHLKISEAKQAFKQESLSGISIVGC